jgi:uncharacterized protein with PQ loop repeat
MAISAMIGFSGAAIAAYAYLPQIHHLIAQRCSAGVSIRAFGLWFVASGLIAIRAIAIGDAVFILLGAVQLIALSLILFYGHKYRSLVCAFHLAHPGAPAGQHPSKGGPEHAKDSPQSRDQARVRPARAR